MTQTGDDRGAGVRSAAAARYFHALAIDFDGTLAQHDRANPEALAALADFRAAGGCVVLVTGRIISELRAVFPEVHDHVDVVVGENGAVIEGKGFGRALAPGVSDEFCDALAERGVRFRRGEVLVACSASDEADVLAEVRRLELEYQLIRNRSELMVLPAGVSKGSGLFEALGDLGISRHNTISLGDAENDHSLIDVAELGVAVGDAVDSLKAHADVVLDAPNGAGVAAFVRGPILSGRERVPRRRWRLLLGTGDDGAPVSVSASQTNLLVTGTTHGGKSHLTGLVAERLIGMGYSVLVVDPEGDHGGLGQARGVLVVGGSGRLPSPEELVRLVRHRFGSVVVDLSTVPEEDRAEYLQAAPAEVEAARERTGLPHWVILDEAHELLGSEGVAKALLEPGGAGYCLVTHRPQDLPPEALIGVDVIIALGGAPPTDEMVNLVAAGGAMPHAKAVELLAAAGEGQAVLVDRRRPGVGTVFTIGRRTTLHVRHWHKYAIGRLPVERRFYFRSAHDQATGASAGNIEELERYLRSCAVEVMHHHGANADFSRWVTDVLGDSRLGGEIARIEGDLRAGRLDAGRARARCLEAIHRRYPS
jgi:hydroxymethylpyrimidine pyrophosphatase-like HAD family hydrolase